MLHTIGSFTSVDPFQIHIRCARYASGICFINPLQRLAKFQIRIDNDYDSFKSLAMNWRKLWQLVGMRVKIVSSGFWNQFNSDFEQCLLNLQQRQKSCRNFSPNISLFIERKSPVSHGAIERILVAMHPMHKSFQRIYAPVGKISKTYANRGRIHLTNKWTWLYLLFTEYAKVRIYPCSFPMLGILNNSAFYSRHKIKMTYCALSLSLCLSVSCEAIKYCQKNEPFWVEAE